MQYGELIDFLQHVGKDPSRLIFEDELTGIHNRRFLLSYLEHKVQWKKRDDFPLSLLTVDLDRFKHINDTHGHDAGDQVLTWLAMLITDEAGEHGVPVRYGGDEFMLLLPNTDATEARKTAHSLLERSRERPFRLRESGTRLPITLSVGIATAPQDAKSSSRLLQVADTALYHAKRSGRNQVASAEDVELERVFSKAALYQLHSTGIFGRDKELSLVSQALESLMVGKSQFLVFEGSPGIGKTAVLDTVARNLSDEDLFHVVKVGGVQREAFRPYYLIMSALVQLLNRRDDGGSGILSSLTPEEVSYLSYMLPHLEDQRLDAPEDDTARREGIFRSLVSVLSKTLEYRPLVLLIDDLQLADEASLLLLGALLRSDDLQVLACGAATESMRLGGEDQAVPFDRFFRSWHTEVEIQKHTLSPLTAHDTAEYLQGVFPNLNMPKGFEHELAELTQGNPLFTSEIVRKLVRDQRVTLVGQEWTIEPLDDDYLPRSLEESVMGEIAILDEAERDLLEHASTFGEDVSISALTAATNQDEGRVLEFLDRAEALGLVRSSFELNDETMRFLGRRVLEIAYGNVDRGRRKILHEEVGNYQEGLRRRGLAPSESLLAYHFKRSTNQEKAQRYEHLQASYMQAVFNAREAADYAAGFFADVVEAEERLDPVFLHDLVPRLCRELVTTARSIQLYPAESSAVARPLAQVSSIVGEILGRHARLSISQLDGELAMNGEKLDAAEFRPRCESLLSLMDAAQLQGFAFLRGVGEDELAVFLEAFGRPRTHGIDRRYWKRFLAEQGLENVDARQIRYSEIKQRPRHELELATLSVDELDDLDLSRIPAVLRSLNRAAKSIGLYPRDSPAVNEATSELHRALHSILARRASLSLSAVDDSMLANGIPLDTSALGSLAEPLVELMHRAGLRSITFVGTVSEGEIGAFIGGLRDLPADVDDEYWQQLADAAGLRGVSLNEHQYALRLVESMLLDELTTGERRNQHSSGHPEPGGHLEIRDATGDPAEEPADVSAAAKTASADHEDGANIRRDLPRIGRELLLSGENDLFRQLLHELFAEFDQESSAVRLQIVDACDRLLDGLTLAMQRKYTELAAGSLITALANEQEALVLHELATVLHVMAGTAVQFADYPGAGRIFLALRSRREDLERGGRAEDLRLAKILHRNLDPTVRQLLEDDLRSGDTGRQELAVATLGALGEPGMPLLIEVINQEKNFRVRQMAASLLSEMGPRAAAEIKQALNLSVIIEHRFRILEVIDVVTDDLKEEIAYNLGDGNPKIRRAAFRLAERVHSDGLIEVLEPLGNSRDPGVVKGAIRSLAHLRSRAAAVALAGILERQRDRELIVACCQALGQVGDAAGIDALAEILAARRFGIIGYRWDDQVRATAALALRQIADPLSDLALEPFANDRDSRIRQLSQGSPTAAS